MNSLSRILIALALGLVLAGWSTGCQSAGGHEMAAAPQGQPVRCQSCYDQTRIVRNERVKGVSYRVVRKHMCKDCDTEAVLYAQDGRMMIKCAGCAPEGIPCDKCLPPKGGH